MLGLALRLVVRLRVGSYRTHQRLATSENAVPAAPGHPFEIDISCRWCLDVQMGVQRSPVFPLFHWFVALYSPACRCSGIHVCFGPVELRRA